MSVMRSLTKAEPAELNYLAVGYITDRAPRPGSFLLQSHRLKWYIWESKGSWNGK